MYGLVGFFVVPPILKPRLIDAVSRQTNCPVTIGDVKVNPFALSLTLDDVALLDRRNKSILSFKELYINFELSSLFHQAYTFSHIHLISPFIYVGIRPDGNVNLKDIQGEPHDKPEDTAAAPPLRLTIQDLAIDSGKVVFEDSSRQVPFREVVDSLGFSLTDFTTISSDAGGYTFEASTGSNELIHWKGNFSVVPLRSSGSFELKNIHARRIWEYFRQFVNLEVSSGQMDFHADYSLDLSKQQTLLDIRNGSFETRSLIVSSSVDSVRAIDLPLLTVSGIHVDYAGKNVTVGSVTTKGLSLTNGMAPDGTITLKAMFLPKDKPADTASTPTHIPWKITFKKVECIASAFHNVDRTTNPPARIDIDSADITLDSLRLDKPAPAALSLTARLNGAGNARANGTMVLDIGNTAVDIAVNAQCSDVSLMPFQPYLNDYSKAVIKSGNLDAAGKARFLLQGKKYALDYDGQMNFAGARIVDPVLEEDFFRCAGLELNTLSFHQSSHAFSVKEIVARQPYIRMIIGPDSITNIRHIMVSDTSAQDTTGPKRQVAVTAAAPAAPRMKSRIGQIRILGGSLSFSDHSMKPNFSVGVEDLAGTISGLSSEELSRADLDLAGKVDKYAPAIIKGQINPLSEEAYTDVTMTFRGIELTTLSPYSGRFAGYKIEKGKLNVDLNYKLNKEHLDGQNKIILDQLTLGEKVESPDATSLPVKLAIALLKDSHGVIDLDIPVSGDLNDPQFSLMPIILKVFVNIITKAVLSPFKLLGALFGGGGDDLQYVVFAAGEDSLNAHEQTKLASVAKALTERPNLSLEIRGIAVDTLDRKVIAEDSIFSKIRPRAPLAKSVEELTETQRNGLFDLYKNTFKDDPKNLLVPSSDQKAETTKDAEERAMARAAYAKLVGACNVSDEALRALASRRADAVKSYIILNGGIGAERIFLTDPNTKASPKDDQVQMELSLTAK